MASCLGKIRFNFSVCPKLLRDGQGVTSGPHGMAQWYRLSVVLSEL